MRNKDAEPSCMNVQMAAALGLCPAPKTAAEGLRLYDSRGNADLSSESPRKTLAQRVSSPFAHLRQIELSPALRRADRSASSRRCPDKADGDTAAFILNAGRQLQPEACQQGQQMSSHDRKAAAKRFTSADKAAAFIMSAGRSAGGSR